MFDFRYHALSLAAVLFALALGVLIGVAIGDSNLVSSAKNGIVHDLDSEIDEAHRQAGVLRERLGAQEDFSKSLYPLAVHELLNSRSIGLVFLGEPSNQINALVQGAITQAGGSLATVVAVREPLDLSGIEGEASGTRYTPLSGAPETIERLGSLIGKQLVSGGSLVGKELITRVRSSLLSAFDGQLTHLEGLVVARSAPSNVDAEAAEADGRLEDGLLAGVGAVGVPAVGVELTSTQPSQVPWYKSRKISSVDDLDAQAGQAALVYALAGDQGTFGVKSTADSLLPAVVNGAGGG